MDRAERRQRRHDQKYWQGERPGRGRGRGYKPRASEASNCESKDGPGRFVCSCCGRGADSTPKFRSGPAGPNSLCNACGIKWANERYPGDCQNASQEEGTDGVTVYEGETKLSPENLQARLHLSDARGSKWETIAAERLEEIKELRIEIQCLNQKIKEITEAKMKEITEAKAARHEHLELKLRAENKSLQERNDMLFMSLDNWVKHQFSEMENLKQIMQNAKSNKPSTHYQASQGTANAGRYVRETNAEAKVCAGNPKNGRRESSKQTGNFDRNGCESAAELEVDAEQRTSAYPKKQTEHSGGHADENPNECLRTTEKVGNVEKRLHDSMADVTIDIGGQSCEEDAVTPSGLQTAPNIRPARPAGIRSEDVSQGLFLESERNAALTFVTKELVMWLNSRTRRPTPKEMSSHKSQVKQRSLPPGEEAFYWTGLTGSRILDRFHADTALEKPSCNALSNLLGSVLHIEGSKWAGDMLWCLVWADCTEPTQLPGYTDCHLDTKRARTADDEVAMKSAKARQS